MLARAPTLRMQMYAVCVRVSCTGNKLILIAKFRLLGGQLARKLTAAKNVDIQPVDVWRYSPLKSNELKSLRSF